MSNINWGHLLFGFSGRINRAKWWLTVLIAIIINIVTLIVATLLADTAAAIVTFATSIILLWISIAAAAKRLHDLNRSAAWLVLFYGGPILLVAVLFAYAGVSVGAALLTGAENIDPAALTRLGGVAILIIALAVVLGIWALIWFGCLRGTVGPNRYGPDPLEGRI